MNRVRSHIVRVVQKLAAHYHVDNALELEFSKAWLRSCELDIKKLHEWNAKLREQRNVYRRQLSSLNRAHRAQKLEHREQLIAEQRRTQAARDRVDIAFNEGMRIGQQQRLAVPSVEMEAEGFF